MHCTDKWTTNGHIHPSNYYSHRTHFLRIKPFMQAALTRDVPFHIRTQVVVCQKPHVDDFQELSHCKGRGSTIRALMLVSPHADVICQSLSLFLWSPFVSPPPEGSTLMVHPMLVSAVVVDARSGVSTLSVSVAAVSLSYQFGRRDKAVFSHFC